MRTLVGAVVAAVVGTILAVTAAFAIVATNAPDQEAEQQLREGNTSETSVVEYGQR